MLPSQCETKISNLRPAVKNAREVKVLSYVRQIYYRELNKWEVYAVRYFSSRRQLQTRMLMSGNHRQKETLMDQAIS